jgi:hypothetical protein
MIACLRKRGHDNGSEVIIHPRVHEDVERVRDVMNAQVEVS